MTAATIIPAALPSLPLEERKALPDTAAVYFVLAGDTMLYIGQSVNVRQRWYAHHRFAQLNAYGGCRIAWLHVDDARLLDDLEQACRAHFRPILNNSAVLGSDCTIVVRIPRAIYARISDLAAADQRSVSWMTRRLIETALDAPKHTEPR